MTIEPIVKNGLVCVTADPQGCEAQVKKHIEDVKSSTPLTDAPKRVLIIGGSSGLGLASRISLAFGGGADTINVSYERGPSEKTPTGTAGFHNNVAFAKFAHEAGIKSYDILGDAFSAGTRAETIELIKTTFGQVDCVVYSLATGVRPSADGKTLVRSALKTVGQSFTGGIATMEPPAFLSQTIDIATEQEIEDTIYVMGGSAWLEWITALQVENLLVDGCKTISYSYIGSEVTHPVYFRGSLGYAKRDLHRTADDIHAQLKSINGEAYVGVCPAITSKASVFIPGLSAYVFALIKTLKERGEYHDGQWHMHRLMSEFLYNGGAVPVDGQRLIRVDDIELNSDVQKQASEMIKHINADTFQSPEFGDYEQFRKEFFALNGFTV